MFLVLPAITVRTTQTNFDTHQATPPAAPQYHSPIPFNTRMSHPRRSKPPPRNRSTGQTRARDEINPPLPSNTILRSYGRGIRLQVLHPRAHFKMASGSSRVGLPAGRHFTQETLESVKHYAALPTENLTSIYRTYCDLSIRLRFYDCLSPVQENLYFSISTHAQWMEAAPHFIQDVLTYKMITATAEYVTIGSHHTTPLIYLVCSTPTGRTAVFDLLRLAGRHGVDAHNPCKFLPAIIRTWISDPDILVLTRLHGRHPGDLQGVRRTGRCGQMPHQLHQPRPAMRPRCPIPLRQRRGLHAAGRNHIRRQVRTTRLCTHPSPLVALVAPDVPSGEMATGLARPAGR